MTIGPAPDWTEITWLVGDYEGTPTLIAVDVDGNIVVPMMGMTDTGLEVIALDEGHRIIAVIRDPTSDNYIAIDGSGNITCIFKGMGPEGLITLKADEEGRLVAILTDPADVWGIFREMGLAELSSRLRPELAYDHRGELVWKTTFEDGIQGIAFGVDHTNSTGKLTTYTSYNGPFSLELDPREIADSYVNYRRVLYPLIGGKVGAAFTFAVAQSPQAIYFRLTFFDGEYMYPGRVTYTTSTKDWTFLNYIGGESMVLENKELQTGVESWHTIKIVIDTVAKKYFRLLIDGEVCDVADYNLQPIEDTGLGVIGVKVEVQGSPTEHAPLYLDSIVVTQNEQDNPE